MILALGRSPGEGNGNPLQYQMPYAVVTAIVCAVMFVITGWFYTPIMLPVAAVILTAAVFVLHKISAKKYGIVTEPGDVEAEV